MRFTKLILAAGMLLAAAPLFAGTLAVGTCLPHDTSFATISAAIAAAPVSGTTTIDVCPGIYPEQLLITKKITLKGVASGGSSAAIITAPGAGLATNASSTFSQSGTCNTSVQCFQAQILVQNTTATIEDLTFDASASNLGSLACYGDPVGIFYQNASGTISRNSVINDILGSGLTGCQGGLGIYVESGTTTIQPNPSAYAPSVVSITYNNVANFQKNGITGNGSGVDVTISNNVAVGEGPWGGAAQNSIQIAFGASGSVTSNTVGSDVWAPDVFGDTGDAAAGILIYGSSNISVTGNAVSNTQYGIAMVDDGSGGDNGTVTNNTITLTHFYDAIDLCGNGNIATGNKITGADESGIHIDDTCTGTASGNQVSSNTVSATCAGVLTGPTASGNSVGTNTYYNTVTQQMTGSDVCTPPATSSVKKRSAVPHGRLQPMKP